jgi:hypothetical protein
MKDQIKSGILTPLEAAHLSPSLHPLFYSEAFVDKLLAEYEISRDLKIEFWNTLQGAAHNLCTLPQYAFARVDAKDARKMLREVDALARHLADLLFALTIHLEPCANAEFNAHHESGDSNTVRRAVYALLCARLKNGGLPPLFNQNEFPFSTKEFCARLTQLADRASLLAKSPYAKNSGPNKLMPLKVYTLTILRFWHVRAGKPYSRSHETHAPSVGRYSRKRTTVSSKRTTFVPFLKACLGELGSLPAERSLQTAIESAIKQLEGRSDEIPLAIADWNFV